MLRNRFWDAASLHLADDFDSSVDEYPSPVRVRRKNPPATFAGTSDVVGACPLL